MAAVTIESAEREFRQYGKPVKRYHSFMYQAGGWETAQKVVVKVEVSSMGTNIRYIVTNLTNIRAKELFKGTEYANATFKTLQNKVIKTAAWVKEMKTKIKIEFPKSCVTKELQIKAFEMLCLLRI